MKLVDMLFAGDLFLNAALLVGACWSIAAPSRGIWPPPSGGSWQQRLSWAIFYLVFGLNATLLFLDWDSWRFNGPLRFIPGAVLVVLGAALVSWGFRTLGVKNTSGQKDGFVRGGPYRFSRNPQYLGDMLLFVGLSLIANSLYLWIAHFLLILVFACAPWAEETWLEQAYGQVYLNYKRDTPRFF